MKPANRIITLSVLLGLSTFARAAATPDSLLAERMLQAASAFSQDTKTEPAAPLVADAAQRLVGNDARLLREMIDLRLQLGHGKKAIELLNAYRKLEPTDELAQVQTIDLLVDQMESADARKTYLSQVVGSESVSAAVRSHAGVKLYSLLIESGDDAAAAEQLKKAIAVNPANPKALQLHLERLYASDAKPDVRAAALVDLLKSNPMQPASIAALAQELARVGASDEAITMYRAAFDMNNALGVAPDASDVINLSAMLLASDKAADAASLAASATQLAPSSARAWYMRAMVEKKTGNQQNLTAIVFEARSALVKNLMVLHRVVDPNSPEITENTVAAMPDVRADAAKIEPSSNLGRSYAAALGDVAWLDIYFGNNPLDPVIAEAIVSLTGENSVDITRLQGFAALASGQTDEAAVKLGAIADRDALAKVGMLAIKLKKGESKDALRPEASKLLASMPVDVWSSTVRQTLADLSPLTFETPDKASVIAASAKLPTDWLNFVRNTGNFYLMELIPVNVGVGVGEPMLMRLRLQNVGKYPLVIGPGGVIGQRVAIDAQVRGLAEQYFPGVAIGRVSGQLVLQPRQSVQTTVRIDSPELNGFISSAPHIPLTIYASAVSNPRIVQQPQGGAAVVPGPGGIRVQATRVMDRQSVALSREDNRKQMASDLQAPDAMKRLLAYQTVIANVQALLNQPTPNHQQKQLADVGKQMLDQAMATETDASIKAMVKQATMGFAAERDQILKSLGTMVAAPEWQTRMGAVLSATGLPLAKRVDLLKPLENDPDESVKQTAAIIVTIPDPAPTTAPASQP